MIFWHRLPALSRNMTCYFYLYIAIIAWIFLLVLQGDHRLLKLAEKGT